MGRDNVLHIMRANKIRQVPVIDEQRRVVGLHLWDELINPAERPNLMVIMAGGLGTRLRPHTESCPKPLLPVAGKPMLEHIVERAKAEGFTRFCFAINYLGHMIEAYFGDGSRWGVSIDYVREEAALGTAGALGLLPQRGGESLVVSNGDVLTDIRYGELLDFHARCNAAATMAVRLHEWQHPYGVVRTSGVDIVGFEEKPLMQSHVNAGIYALRPEALNRLTPGERCDMPALFQRVREQGGRTVVYPMHEPWLDVGRPDDLSLAEHLLRGDSEPEARS
jgi:NDP-sugar pyrophosphorylase family protein